MPRRVEIGPALAALGALLLLVSLFLDWFGARTGWGAFELLDLVLAALAVVALVTAGAALAGGADGWGDTRWLPALGLVAVVAVAAQLLEPPPAVDGDPDTGAWLALAGGALLLLGGVLEATAISISVQVREGRARRRRVSAVDRRAPGAVPASRPIDDDEEPTVAAPARGAFADRGPAAGPPTPAPDEDDFERTQPLPTEERPDR